MTSHLIKARKRHKLIGKGVNAVHIFGPRTQPFNDYRKHWLLGHDQRNVSMGSCSFLILICYINDE